MVRNSEQRLQVVSRDRVNGPGKLLPYLGLLIDHEQTRLLLSRGHVDSGAFV
jgi:3-methyladenine DNA glycosylase Mpg